MTLIGTVFIELALAMSAKPRKSYEKNGMQFFTQFDRFQADTMKKIHFNAVRRKINYHMHKLTVLASYL